MHHTQGGVAFGDAVHPYPRGADIHELLEGELLCLHLAPDAVDMLWPAVDGGLDAGSAQLPLQQFLQFVDVLFALGAARLESRRDVFVLRRLQIAKRQIFQFPFDLPNAEPVGEGRVDLASLDGEFALSQDIQGFG